MLNTNHSCKWAADEPTHRRHNLLKLSLNSLFNLLTALLTVSFLIHCFLMHTHHVVLICMNGIRLHSFGFNCRFALWLPMKRGRALGWKFVYIVKDTWKDKKNWINRGEAKDHSHHFTINTSSLQILSSENIKNALQGLKDTNKQTNKKGSVPTTNQRSKA